MDYMCIVQLLSNIHSVNLMNDYQWLHILFIKFLILTFFAQQFMFIVIQALNYGFLWIFGRYLQFIKTIYKIIIVMGMIYCRQEIKDQFEQNWTKFSKSELSVPSVFSQNKLMVFEYFYYSISLYILQKIQNKVTKYYQNNLQKVSKQAKIRNAFMQIIAMLAGEISEVRIQQEKTSCCVKQGKIRAVIRDNNKVENQQKLTSSLKYLSKDLRGTQVIGERDVENVRGYYQGQLAYLSKSKEYCQNEIEQLKWEIQRYKEQYEIVNQRLKQSNDRVLQLTSQVLINMYAAQRSQEQNKESTKINQNLRTEIAQLQRKYRLLEEKLKNKMDFIYQIQKKNQNYESQLFVLNEKWKQVDRTNECNKIDDQKKRKQRQKVLHQRGQEIAQLRIQLITVKEQLSSFRQEIAIKNNQITYLKQSKQELLSKQLRLDEFRKQLKQSQQNIEKLVKQKEDLFKLFLDEQKKNSTKLKKELEDYRKQTSKALQKLLEQIGKDEQNTSSKHNLLGFPDSTVSIMQVQAIKKRHVILTKYQSTIQQLQQQKSLLELQVKKGKNKLQEKEEEYQKSIKAQREKNKQIVTDFAVEREYFENAIQNLQDKKLKLAGQVQKLKNQIKKREQIIEEVREEIIVITKQRQNLKLQLKLSEQAIFALRSNEIKWKVINQSKITQIFGQNESTTERYKATIFDLQKRVSSEQMNNKEKEQAIKRLEFRLNQFKYQKERNEARGHQMGEKLILSVEEKKELEKKVKVLENELRQYNLQLQTAKQSLSNQKVKLQQIQNKLNDTYSSLSQSQISNQKIKTQLQSSKQTISLLQNQIKDKQNKSKNNAQKTSLQISNLNQKIKSLILQIDTKCLQINQHEVQIVSLKQNLSECKDNLNNKEQDFFRLEDKLLQYKNKEIQTSQNMQTHKSQKEFLKKQNERLKQRVILLQGQLSQLQIKVERFQLQVTKQLQTLRLQKDKVINSQAVGDFNRMTKHW